MSSSACLIKDGDDGWLARSGPLQDHFRPLLLLPRLGILLPIMGSKHTVPLGGSLSLFGKTRQALLSQLYTRPDEALLQEDLIRLAALGRGSVQRELDFLTRAGILHRMVRGRQVYFQANPDCPIYPEVRALIVKTAGVADVLRNALVPLADRVELAFVYGSVARAQERRGSDVDVMIIGEVSFSDASQALGGVQATLGREVNPSVYSAREFRAKLLAKHPFLNSVFKGKKIFLIGDEHALARLARQ